MYCPSPKILSRYAHLLIQGALGRGQGIRKGDVVHLIIGEQAKPLMLELRKAVWQAGGHLLLSYLPDDEERYGPSKDFFDHATPAQLRFFADTYYKGVVDQVDHIVFILGASNPRGLALIPANKLLTVRKAMKPYLDWRLAKEDQGRLTWTIGLYPTPAMAAQVGLDYRLYWQQVIRACFLDKRDPLAHWQKVRARLRQDQVQLSQLPIQQLHFQGEDIDITIGLGAKRQWQTGSGHNVPSFEIFTSPDWRQTQGHISFNQPLYYQGNCIEGIELTFDNGRVVNAHARTNQSLLKAIVAVPGADKIGEISLTDKRLSRIEHVMGETLYDENMGGPFGNMHLALGSAYHDCFVGEVAAQTQRDWTKLGFNTSALHVDIISTTDRVVTATLRDGSQRVIYKNGEFTL